MHRAHAGLRHRAPSLLALVTTLLVLTGQPACVVDTAPATDTAAQPVRTSTEPDPGLTPGALCSADDPHFDGYRYAEHVPHCRRSVSRSRKDDVYEAYGVPDDERGAYEVDHRISLSLGGDNSFENLWPLYQPAARRKAQLEQQLYLDLRDGRIDQATAIDAVLNWR